MPYIQSILYKKFNTNNIRPKLLSQKQKKNEKNLVTLPDKKIANIYNVITNVFIIFYCLFLIILFVYTWVSINNKYLEKELQHMVEYFVQYMVEYSG